MHEKSLYLFAVLLLFILLTACSPEQQLQKQIDKAVSEPFTYTTYRSDGFSVKYPYWPEAGNNSGDTEVSVSRGYCSVAINQEKIPAGPWFDMVVESVEDNKDSSIISEDSEEHRLEYETLYQNLTLINDARVFSCNDHSYVVLVFCIEQVYDESQDIYDTVFDSVECEEDEEDEEMPTEAQIEAVEQTLSLEDLDYHTFHEDDFAMQHPDGWDEMDGDSDERVLGVSAGVCSVIVNKHNARPEDLAHWIDKTVDEKDDHDLLEYSEDDDVYRIDYTFSADEHDLIARSKMFYCNYMTYSAMVVCLEDVDVPGMDELADDVLSSARCKKEYTIPTPKVVEQKREEVEEEEPEELEEIEDDIVRTDAGEEYGIDEEIAVYFINNNAFFTKIMKDFPEANLEIEDDDNDRTLELKVTVDPDSGKITRLEDGAHSSPDVTLIIPLRDALNIFTNAENLNPLNLLSFAVNVKTEPAEIKDQVIRDVLQGKYK